MKLFLIFSMLASTSTAFASPQFFGREVIDKCPLVQAKNRISCGNQASNCWNPGTADIDCDHGELCCFNGCVNVCTKPTRPQPMRAQCREVKEIRQENKVEQVCSVEHNEECKNVVTYHQSEKPGPCQKKCTIETEVLPQKVAKQKCENVPERKCSVSQMEVCSMANQPVQVPITERQCSTSVERRCQTRQQDQCTTVGEERCHIADTVLQRRSDERQCGNPIDQVQCEVVSKEQCFTFQDQKVETRTRKSCKTFRKEVCELLQKPACFDTVKVICSPVTSVVSFPYKDTVCKFLPKRICQNHDVEICNDSKSHCKIAQVETCHDSETEVEKHCKVNRKVKTDTVSENKCRETRGQRQCSTTNEAVCNSVPEENCMEEKYDVIVPFERKKCGTYQFNQCRLTAVEGDCTSVSMVNDYIESGQVCNKHQREICEPVDYEHCTDIPHELCNSKVVYKEEHVMKQICSLMPQEQCNVVNQERCQTIFETIDKPVQSKVCKDVCAANVKINTPITNRECSVVPQNKCENKITPMTYEVSIMKCDW